MMVRHITPGELQLRLAAADPPLVLDVREPWEIEIVRLPSTVDIPMGEVSVRHGELPRDRDIIVMCRSGGRSAQVAAFLAREGCRAHNLAGGILAWARDIDPTLDTY